MINKEKIKDGLLYTLLLIVLVSGAIYVMKFWMDTTNYIVDNIRYREWKKFEKEFEKEMERYGEETFEKSELREEQEKKNPLPLELKRERFVSGKQIIGFHKKYLTAMEFT
ncbi:MAG: hypothetical protein NT166_00380, partial [Candidatus Aminicenantes bacterium]|nr:hypothetical protein [Candidatus Aminicenantes bacterium]